MSSDLMSRLRRVRFSRVLLAGLLCAGFQVAQAALPGTVPTAPGATVIPGLVPPGTPAGTLIDFRVAPFSFTTSAGTTTGTLTSAVYREAGGTMDFYYQVRNNAGSATEIARETNTNFVGFTTATGFRTDGTSLPGGIFVDSAVAPVIADSNGPGTVVGFGFTPPDAAKIFPGMTSAVLVISTNATDYRPGNSSVIDGGTQTVLAFQPFAGSTTVTLDCPYQVRYASNLNIGDAVVNITNTGAQGASLFGPGFGGAAGNICVNVYAFSPDEQLVSCCSCLLTPNALASISVYNDLTSNTLTGVRPDSVVIKLVATATGGTLAAPTFNGTNCSNSAATIMNTAVVTGLAAWGTTLHPFAPTVGDGLPGPLTGFYYGAEGRFRCATFSDQERASIASRCTNIIGNGSTFGVCRACQQIRNGIN